jgi:hypothetical protein
LTSGKAGKAIFLLKNRFRETVILGFGAVFGCFSSTVL